MSEYIKNRNKEIVRLYKDRIKTRAELSQEYFLEERTIFSILSESGIKYFWDTKISQRKEQMPEIIKEYNSGVSRKELSAKYNIPDKTLYVYLKESKVKLWDLRKKRKNREKPKKISKYFSMKECWNESIYRFYNDEVREYERKKS